MLLSLRSAPDCPELLHEHPGAQTHQKIKGSGLLCGDLAGLLLSGSLSDGSEGAVEAAAVHGCDGDGVDYGLPSAGALSAAS